MTGKTAQERFWEKVDLSNPDGCWLWTAAKTSTGYGSFAFDGPQMAHRVSYEWHVGPIPEGYVVDHLCDTPACVRWDHLNAVTQKENLNRSPLSPHRRTHCARGHEFTEANTYYAPSAPNKRKCLACHRQRKRDAYKPRTKKTHCPNGHPYEGDNLVQMPNGRRRCKACSAAADARWYEKKKGGVQDRHRPATEGN